LSWNNKNTYRFSKVIKWFSSSTSKYYMPMSGSVNESSDADNAVVQFVPSNSGKLISIDITTDGATPGDTIFTLEDSASGTLGTLTLDMDTAQTYTIDFTAGLDSGTNVFDGLGLIRVGVDPTIATNTVMVVITFEIDL